MSVTGEDSATYFPLRSNAAGLLSGAAVEVVRQRLKMAALVYDHVFLEDGGLLINAGPTGSFSVTASEEEQARWQTPKERSDQQRGVFQVSVARETTPGVAAAGPFTSVIHSESTISWKPTFMPFEHELPTSLQDSIVFVIPSELTREGKNMARAAANMDERNPTVTGAFPMATVRSLVVQDTNHDLLTGLATHCSVSVDGVHQRVAECRLGAGNLATDPRVPVLPVIIPDARQLAWEDVATLRRHRDIAHFRKLIWEIGQEASISTSTPETFAYEALRRYAARLEAANERASSLIGEAKSTALGFLGGSIAETLVTGLVSSTHGLVGAATGFGMNRLPFLNLRRPARWVSVASEIRKLASVREANTDRT